MDHSEWCAVVISRMMPMSPLGVKTVSEVAFPPSLPILPAECLDGGCA